MKAQLSHKDIVKLGLHESKHGRSLSQIEADFHKIGIGRKEAIRALDTIDHIKKSEEQKANQQSHAKSENKDAAAKNDNNAKEAAGKNKSNFLFWVLVLLILIGIGYLFYEGILSTEIFGISLK